jgi:hypothetical protein
LSFDAIYAQGQGSHIVMSIEALPLVEELIRRTEFRVLDPVRSAGAPRQEPLKARMARLNA